MTGRAALAVSGALLITASAGAAASGLVEPLLWARLQRIETAFRSGDAHSLRALLPAETKVRIDLGPLTDGSRSYGPGQLEVVFQQIFAVHPTVELTFRAEDVKVPAPGTAFARARWTRRPDGGGRETVEWITFTLRDQSGDWRIHEILCSR
jgi:hypothetical protein